MEKRGVLNLRILISLVITLFISIFYLAIIPQVFAADSVADVRPDVTAVFTEDVIPIPPFELKGFNNPTRIINMTLTHKEGGVLPESGRIFTFSPTESLGNDQFTFTLYVQDLVGNVESHMYNFEVFVPGSTISLFEPNSLGVANSTTFRVGVRTTRPSICKHSGVEVASFNNIRLELFDITGNESSGVLATEHFINDFEVIENFPEDFFVVCKDNLGRDFFEEFVLYADTVVPTLDSVYFSPSPILEYPAFGNIRSTLNVQASEPVLCKYTDNENRTFNQMNAFDGYNELDFDVFDDSHSQEIFLPEDTIKETFNFYVQCIDRAGFRSEKLTKQLRVDLTEGLQVSVTSPVPFSKNTKPVLNVSTNKRAYCMYKAPTSEFGDPIEYNDPRASLGSSSRNLLTDHSKVLSVRSSGSYPISILCRVPAGVSLEDLTEEVEYTFTIDTSPPSAPTINASSPLCEPKITAEIFAEDEVSGIREYIYKLLFNAKNVSSGSTSSSFSIDAFANGTKLILEEGVTYKIEAQAVDGAGNVGPIGSSNTITYDATGAGCDSTPPVVTVVRGEYGDSVTLECSDDISGCSADSVYGTSYSNLCNATQYLSSPVIIPVFKSTLICWQAKDNAGNVVSGEQLIDLTPEDLNISASDACPDGIDSDGDGYGERCMLGDDCDDTDPDKNVVCDNGCISDLDGDGYGKGCNAGNDCDGMNANLTTSCPNGCVSDNDGDGFGLGCSSGADCKGDDSTLSTSCPNGCVSDNDGDGFGLGCAAGLDCNGENPNDRTDCSNNCIQDSDGDGFGLGCDDGPDCNGMDSTISSNCDNGCVSDDDGDGFGFLCDAGLDCNGMNPLMMVDCPNGCVSDNDGDSFGWSCSSGNDCNDTDPFIDVDCDSSTVCVYDHDGDGYGLGCMLGSDCDDYDDTLQLNCTGNCTYDEDCNGLPDIWQMDFFNNTLCDDPTLCDPVADPDEDGYTNIEEYRRGSNPLIAESLDIPDSDSEDSSGDSDGDGMDDDCERLYGLDPNDPSDAYGDLDLDGLDNSFECGYSKGDCTYLNPSSADTDSDGFLDSEEIDAGTDPCNPDDHPSGAWIGLLLIILGFIILIGCTSVLVYFKYYVPLTIPKVAPTPQARPKSVQKMAQPSRVQRAGGQHPLNLTRQHQVSTHHVIRPKKKEIMSSSQFKDEMKKRASERDKLLSAFGERKVIERKTVVKTGSDKPSRKEKPIEFRRIKKEVTKPKGPDYVNQLSSVIGEDYLDKVAGLSKKDANYMGKLATIAKEKEIPLEDDHVSKLANISKKVSDEPSKKRQLTNAFKKSSMDNLDEFLSSKKHVDTFIRQSEKNDDFDSLSSMIDTHKKQNSNTPNKSGSDDSFDALSNLSSSKRKGIISDLNDMTSSKDRNYAMTKIEDLSNINNKSDLLDTFRKLSRDKRMDKGVFEILFSYLLKSGKINKSDVHEIVHELEDKGALTKKDVTDVLRSIGL